MHLHNFILFFLLNYQRFNTIKIDPNDVIIKKYFIQSTSIRNNLTNLTRRSPSCINIVIQYETIILNTCLQIDNKLDHKLVSPDIELIQFENGSESIRNFGQFDVAFAKGYVITYENQSKIDGYIEENVFYGRIHVGEEVYYVEKLTNFPDVIKENNVIDLNQSIIYKAIDLIPDKLSFQRKYRRRQTNICTIVLLIDHSFLEHVAGNSPKTALSVALSTIAHANTIFRSTDFNNDGVPDNVGFQIRYILLMKSYNDQIPFILPFSHVEMDSRKFIERLTYITNFRDGCIGITFTAQPFVNSIIGVSYTAVPQSPKTGQFTSGGFCVTTAYRNFNIVTVTYLYKSSIIPQMICDVSITHELGHSFGSLHDTPNCDGFIMSDKTSLNVTVNSFRFSSCSRNQINEILQERSFCLKTNFTTFCGNGLIEGNEECDCGSFYSCSYSDNCCYPFNHEKGCKIKRDMGFTCHPSQGLCCLPSCKIRNISHMGLSCTEFQNKCITTGQQTCGVDGRCIKRQCNSNECARIGLTECRCAVKSTSFCQTCCYHQNACISAIKASSIILKLNLDLIPILNKTFKEFVRTKHDVVQKICVGNACTDIGFKIFPIGQFCVYNGFLGKCQKPNECFVQMPYVWYPTNFDVVKNNAQNYNVNYFVLVLMVLIINYIV